MHRPTSSAWATVLFLLVCSWTDAFSPRNGPAFRKVPSLSRRRFSSSCLRSTSSSPEPPSSLPFTSMALVAGNSVGAGVLALPESSLSSGFLPSTFALVVVWVGCVCTALLVAEVMINSEGSQEPSIYSVAEETLGPLGGVVACSTFILLNYSLLVAYFAKGGQILAEVGATLTSAFTSPELFIATAIASSSSASASTDPTTAAAAATAATAAAAAAATAATSLTAAPAAAAFGTLTASDSATATITAMAEAAEAAAGATAATTTWVTATTTTTTLPAAAQSFLATLHIQSPETALAVAYAAGIAAFVLGRSPKQRDDVQVFFLVALLGTFCALLAALLPGVDATLLLRTNVECLPSAMPVFVCALVFHNVVPLVVSQQNGDRLRVSQSLVFGSLVPLALYVLFNAAFLGAVEPPPPLPSLPLSPNTLDFVGAVTSGSVAAAQEIVASAAASAAAGVSTGVSAAGMQAGVFDATPLDADVSAAAAAASASASAAAAAVPPPSPSFSVSDRITSVLASQAANFISFPTTLVVHTLPGGGDDFGGELVASVSAAASPAEFAAATASTGAAAVGGANLNLLSSSSSSISTIDALSNSFALGGGGLDGTGGGGGTGDGGGSHDTPVAGALAVALGAKLLLPFFAISALSSSLLGTAVSQLDELAALASHSRAPSGSAPSAVGGAATMILANLERTFQQAQRSSSSSPSLPSRPIPSSFPRASFSRLSSSSPFSSSWSFSLPSPLSSLLLAPLVPFLVFLPPLGVALSFPDIFSAALEFGGVYGDLVLFGLIPVAMAWQQRSQLLAAGLSTTAGLDAATTSTAFSSSSLSSSSSTTVTPPSASSTLTSEEPSSKQREAAAAAPQRGGSGGLSVATETGLNRRSDRQQQQEEESHRLRQVGYDSEGPMKEKEKGEAASSQQQQQQQLVPGGFGLLAALAAASTGLIATYTVDLVAVT